MTETTRSNTRSANETLHTLQAWMELTNAKARYCHLLDTKDWTGFGDLMTDDIELDLSGTSDLGMIRGREEAVARIRSSVETAQTAHHVHTPEITLNGDEALVVWAMQDRLIWSNGKTLTGYGHYNERWVKQNGEWKLAAQKLTRLIMEFGTTAG